MPTKRGSRATIRGRRIRPTLRRKIVAGFAGGLRYDVELDRAAAIERAIATARSDDVVLVAGKGHEAYQEIAGRRIPFRDRRRGPTGVTTMTCSAQRHTVIFGLGITGYSCLRFLHGTDRLTVVDTRSAPPFAESAAIEVSGRSIDPRRGDAGAFRGRRSDRRESGTAARPIACSRGARTRRPLISDIELFLEHAAAPVVGITGTNGKSTVTALTGELLRAAGLDVGVGGNLGEAALDLLAPDRDAYVLELSSFQLERLDAGRFTVAANLNVTAGSSRSLSRCRELCREQTTDVRPAATSRSTTVPIR